MKTGIRLCVVIVVLNLFQLYAAEDPGELFDQAIKLKSIGDDQKASELFTQAASIYEAGAATDWHKWYEAGNSHWWAGEADRAIMDYRRYLALDSFRFEVWENLAEARIKAGTKEPGHEGFLIWPWFLYLASAASFFAGTSFFIFALFLFFRKKTWRKAALVFAIAALVSGLACLVNLGTRGQIAVVIAGTQGRKGDSTVYAPFPSDPWKKGQEVWISEIRDTWTKVQVGNTMSWVPSDTLEYIRRK